MTAIPPARSVAPTACRRAAACGRRARPPAGVLSALLRALPPAILPAMVVAAALSGTGTPALGAPALSLERLLSTPSIDGTRPSSPLWSPDGRYLAFAWNHQGMSRRDLWIATAQGTEVRRLPAARAAGASLRDFAWLPGGRTIVSLRGSGLWATTLDGADPVLLATIGDGASSLTVSPDGSRVAWLQNGDLWLLDLYTRTVRAATDLGIPPLSSLTGGRYSRPEREIGAGTWSGPTYAWSPDGRYIAVHYVDRRDMRAVPFPDYLAPETDPNPVRRGYPGDPNEYRTVGLLDLAQGDLRLLDLDDPTANQVLDFSWSPTGTLLIDIASDTAVDRWLYTVAPETGELRRIWHGSRPSRIYTAFASAWHPDGERVVFLSDMADRYALYVLDPARPGEAAVRLTDPAFDVLGAPAVVPAAGVIFYAANAPEPHERQIFRVDASGGNRIRVTRMPGHHQAYPAPDGRHLAVLHSDDTTPPELYVMDAAGSGARQLTHSPLREFREQDWVAPRYVSFPSLIDDRTLRARVLTPPDLASGKRYPVIFGPVYSNTVRNRWSGVYSLVQQLMVQKGYVVVQVDVRGSTGYGRAFREAFLADFAGADIEDLASAAAWLESRPWVDGARMGLWGSSYGGTLTVYTLLTRPGLFCAGAAAAAAVDPHFFGTDDVAIVRRPDTQPEIFRRTARRYAQNLEDHLLLIHGMQDQIVPFKTTVDLAEALIRAGRDFEFAFAPGATHAWSREPFYAPYLFGRLFAHFDRYLAPDGGCGADRPVAEDGR